MNITNHNYVNISEIIKSCPNPCPSLSLIPVGLGGWEEIATKNNSPITALSPSIRGQLLFFIFIRLSEAKLVSFSFFLYHPCGSPHIFFLIGVISYKKRKVRKAKTLPLLLGHTTELL